LIELARKVQATMTRRTRQVGELLKEELSDIIRREVKDPRIGFMSITSVDVPPDLRSARVYVSVLGTDQERSDTLDALRSAAKFIRFHLKPRLRMRQIPDLEFRDDRSMEYAQQITATLREIKATDQARGIRPAVEDETEELSEPGTTT
jgi:ribosome-binding factor A